VVNLKGPRQVALGVGKKKERKRWKTFDPLVFVLGKKEQFGKRSRKKRKKMMNGKEKGPEKEGDLLPKRAWPSREGEDFKEIRGGKLRGTDNQQS